MTDGDLLKLKAVDADDLAVVAGALQDAIVPVSDMAWLSDEGCFVMAVNRFRWERSGRNRHDRGARVNAGVSFANVVAVKRRAIDFRERGRFLNLLTIALAADGDGSTAGIVLTFSEDAAIRLETTALLCHLEDFGEPWPTQWRPRHPEG